MVVPPHPEQDPQLPERPSQETQVDTTDEELDFGLQHFAAVSDEQGISLDELSKAYAALIGKGDDPYEPSSSGKAGGAEEVLEQAESEQETEPCDLSPHSILEAVLFVGHPRNEPITSERLAGLMRGVPSREIDELIGELNAEYLAHEHPYHIASVGTGYRLELRSEFAPLRNVFYGRIREARLSQAVIDVLAVVAYRQGCTRHDIEQIRGRPSGGLLSQLVRRRLLRVERTDEKPRVPHYYVTDRFLDLFGLASLDELPQSQDVD